MRTIRAMFMGALLHSAAVGAASLELSAINAGFLTAEGGASNFDGLLVEMATYNYSVGWELHYDGGGLKPTVPLIYQEKRNYFVFDLGAVVDPITSAIVELGFPAGGYTSPDATETFILSETPIMAAELAMLKMPPMVPAPPLFDIDPAAIGGIAAMPGGLFEALTAVYDDFGISLGSYTRGAGDADDPIAIPLGPAGIAYLNANLGGTVVLGGKLTSITGGAVAEELFGLTDPWLDVAPPGYAPLTLPPALLLETTPIPLPGALWLFGAALMPLVWRGRQSSL